MVSTRVHSAAVRPRVQVPRVSKAKKATAKPTQKMPALFGTPYERLSPSQQALVRKAVASNPHLGTGQPTFRKGKRFWSASGGGYYDTKAEAIKAALAYGRSRGIGTVQVYQQRGDAVILETETGRPFRNPKSPKPVIDYIIARVEGDRYELRRKLGVGTKILGTFDSYEQATAARKADWAATGGKKNPGKGSFERCVKSVSKRKGTTSPAAVCAASKMRTPRGKAELLRAARAGKFAAMSSKNPFVSLREGKAQADIFQTAPHEFSVRLGAETERFKTFKAAQGWARLRLHEVSNPRGIRVKVFQRSLTKRKNPLDQAAKLFEEFHGFPSTEVLEFVESRHYHSVTTSLGPLVSMIVKVGKNEPFRLRAPDPSDSKIEDIIYLTSTEDGRQLIPVGGDQKVPIDQLGRYGIEKEDQRDHMVLGEIRQVEYRTKKSFEENGKVLLDFYHDLGKEHSKGRCPVLIYKPRDPSLEIAGGRYFIGAPEASLGGVSPGLVG